MKLRHDEERFLRHWIYDEAHFQSGQGRAKLLQLQHRALPAELALLIAAGIPDLAEQAAAANESPADGPLHWPWPDDLLEQRVAEARTCLAQRRPAAVN